MNRGNRKSIRLKGYDYSQPGYYFITICTQDREYLFGEIINGKMLLNDAGQMVDTIWNEIPIFYNGFEIHGHIVMPNHFHGIIKITNENIQSVGAGPRACPSSDRTNPNSINHACHSTGRINPHFAKNTNNTNHHRPFVNKTNKNNSVDHNDNYRSGESGGHRNLELGNLPNLELGQSRNLDFGQSRNTEIGQSRNTESGQPQKTEIGQPQGVAPTGNMGMGLGDIVHRFKTLTTKKYCDGVKQQGWVKFKKRVWQRNYWEHIIRNENELKRIANYIRNNPENWLNDKLNGGDGNIVMEPPAAYNEEIWMV